MKGGGGVRKTVIRTVEREPVLSGENVVSIVIAIKELLINLADNYRMIRISQRDSISEGGK